MAAGFRAFAALGTLWTAAATAWLSFALPPEKSVFVVLAFAAFACGRLFVLRRWAAVSIGIYLAGTALLTDLNIGDDWQWMASWGSLAVTHPLLLVRGWRGVLRPGL